MSASVEIVTIGTELLLGAIIDKNSAVIAQAFAAVGLNVYAKHSVGDNADRLRDMLVLALERADGVVTTGGLGPTVDDLTKDAIAQALDTDLVLHEPSITAMEERFRMMGRTVTDNNRRQAYLPRDAFVLTNPHGTAPGFVALRADGKFIASMPGVPREMRPMLDDHLVPWLRNRFGLNGGILTRILHTAGMGESEVDRRIEDLFRSHVNPKIAVLAHNRSVDVKISAKVDDLASAPALIAPVENEVRARLGDAIFGTDADTLEAVILAKLRAEHATLAIAESCTGGALSDAFVAVPGASDVFLGSVVAYANSAKEAMLGVPSDVLLRHGAVSEATAIAMAEGALQRFSSDYALSTTGVAGPGGGSEAKPVGLVYIGLAIRGKPAIARRYQFPGERSDIRSRAVNVGLILLAQTIRSGG